MRIEHLKIEFQPPLSGALHGAFDQICGTELARRVQHALCWTPCGAELHLYGEHSRGRNHMDALKARNAGGQKIGDDVRLRVRSEKRCIGDASDCDDGLVTGWSRAPPQRGTEQSDGGER